MGKRVTQFLKTIAGGLGIGIDDSLGSGGPGRSNRKGIPMIKLFQMFPDDEAAREWLESAIWPNGPVCPKCGSGDNVRLSTHKSMPYRCAGYRRHFSVKVGTVLEQSKMGYQKWVLAIYQVITNARGISGMKIHRDLGIRQSSAWFTLHHLREALCSLALPEHVECPVEIDEMYAGGREKTSTLTRKAGSKKWPSLGPETERPAK